MSHLTLLMLAVAAAAQSPRSYVCRQTAQAPKIDGDTSDAAWATAAPAPVFYETGPAGSPLGQSIRVRFLFDSRNLYVSGDITLPGGRALRARPREHDGKLWFDDNVEVFLKPTPFAGPSYHLALTAAGAAGDFIHGARTTAKQAKAWNPAWEAAVKRKPGAWSFEAAIPFSAFDAAAPHPGHVWLIKVGCVRPGAMNAMWPRNREHSFHNPAAFGALVFESRSLLRNGAFEAQTDKRGWAPGWSRSYVPKQGKGVIRVAQGGLPPGKQCARYEKFDNYKWFPQLWTERVPIQPGSTYRVRAWVRCPIRSVTRYTLFGPKKVEKHHRPVAPAPKWAKIEYEFAVPPSFERVALGFQLSRAKGVLWVDNVSLERVNDTAPALPPLPEPDPIHKLVELSRRRRFKPFALLKTDGHLDRADGWYETDRVIFRDTGTGATIYKLPRSGGSSTRHIYMEMSPWNADGSLLMLTTGQLGKGTFVAPADGHAWRRLPYYASSYQWDRLDPKLLYYRALEHGKWVLYRRRLDAPKPERLRVFDGEISLWPMHPDGHYLLIRETFNNEKPPRSVIWVMNRDGRRFIALHPPHRVHQTWFTKLPDHSVEFEFEGQRPRGQYRMTLDDKLIKITDETFGHRAHSPDGQWIAAIGRCRLISVDGRRERLLADVGENHETWRTSNDWYAASSGRRLIRVSTTKRFTYQQLGSHNSRLKYSTYWSEAHPEMSADGTKLCFASNMLHNIEFYWLVMGLPQAPQQFSAERRGRDIVLRWKRPARATELAGYLVYRSQRSGDRGAALMAKPIRGETFTDRAPGAGPWVYAVTAVEHSGLESLLSNEAIVGDAEQAVFIEAESGEFQLPVAEVFDPTASGLYAVQLGQVRTGKAMPCRFELPRGGTFVLWLRARLPRGASPGEVECTLDGGPAGAAPVKEPKWTWIRGPRAQLKPGAHAAALHSRRPGPVIDQLGLAPPDWRPPAGTARADLAPPPAPTQVAAEPKTPYAIRLRWRKADANDLDHYNVYCAAPGEVAAAQECLVGSPSEPTFLDWGLEAGKAYAYVVTAVDRSGNESPASRPAAARTPALAYRLLQERGLDINAKAPMAEWNVRVEEPIRVVLWLRARSLTGQRRSYPVRVQVDGHTVCTCGLPFHYVSVGHGGPVVGVPLWGPAAPPRRLPRDAVGFALPAGEHAISVELLSDAPMRIDRAALTNDLGWLPPGRCDFLLKPIRPPAQ